MTKPNGQCGRLLDYLQAHRDIGVIQAQAELGIYRLAAVVFKLRRMGYMVQSRTVPVVNRWGEKCNVARYSLERVH